MICLAYLNFSILYINILKLWLYEIMYIAVVRMSAIRSTIHLIRRMMRSCLVNLFGPLDSTSDSPDSSSVVKECVWCENEYRWWREIIEMKLKIEKSNGKRGRGSIKHFECQQYVDVREISGDSGETETNRTSS
jgi:hypothetical protein